MKQSSRVWNDKVNSVLVNFGLNRCEADQWIFYSLNGNKMLFVEDVVLFYNNRDQANRVQNGLCKNFKMKDLGEISSILAIQVIRDQSKGIISIDQSQILKGFNVADYNPVSTPLDLNQKISSKMCAATEKEKQQMKDVPYMEAFGFLLYAQITRPDICYAVNLLSRNSRNPDKLLCLTIKLL